MQAVEDPPIETIHLYVVREKEKRPYTLLPLFGAFLCLAAIVGVTVYSAYHPYYEHETLRIPAHFLPLKNFIATVPIIPTGIQTYPATRAHGMLTLTNGSVISQQLPQGLIFTGKDGVEVVTDNAVFVPAGSADGYGYATVSVHALIGGKIGNIPAYDIDRVEGSSIYIRNLTSFHGGKDSYIVPLQLPQDRQTAIDSARAILASQQAQIHEFLAFPCNESSQVGNRAVGLSWACQYVTYTVPSYMKVTHIKLVGKSLFVDVVFVPRPRIMVAK